MADGNAPLWRQVSDELVGEIDSGNLKPGSRLPSSRQLAEKFGVNRHTVLRSIADLEERGLVRVEAGRRGTYVMENAIRYRLGARNRFEDNLLELRYTPTRRIISIAERPPSEEVAQELDLVAGELVMEVVLLDQANGIPLSYGHHYFAIDRFPRLGLVLRNLATDGVRELSLADALAEAGIADLRRKAMRIRSRLPTREEAQFLQIPRTDTVMELHVINVDGNDQLCMASSATHAGSRVEFTMQF